MTHGYGIPTTYAGVRFRSRLEARWAAFFTALGWPWQYEPFDLPGYIPDFAICGDWPVLVDVRPYSSFDELAARAHEIAKPCMSWHHDYVVVGTGPVTSRWGRDFPTLGRIVEYQRWGDDREASHAPPGDDALLFRCDRCGDVAVCSCTGLFTGRPCGHYDGDHYVRALRRGFVTDAWAAATNTVRWK